MPPRRTLISVTFLTLAIAGIAATGFGVRRLLTAQTSGGGGIASCVNGSVVCSSGQPFCVGIAGGSVTPSCSPTQQPVCTTGGPVQCASAIPSCATGSAVCPANGTRSCPVVGSESQQIYLGCISGIATCEGNSGTRYRAVCHTASGGGGPTGGAACICGDYVIVRPEECDNGTNNSDTVPNACRTDCKKARCGDNVVDAGEKCDHGSSNGKPGDSCPSGCGNPIVGPRCGDGSRNQTSETCDDGNTQKGDGCDDTCKEEPGWKCNPSGGGGSGSCPAAYPLCTQDTNYAPRCPSGKTFAYPNPYVQCGSGEARGSCYSCN